MERLVQEINAQHTHRKRWRRIWSLAAGLAAFFTTYVLILPAITMSRQLVCGKTEHTHSESCYASQDALICNMEEHTHSEFCYDVGPADVNADVENPEDWEKTISQVALSGRRGEDVAAVAMTQLGYRESNRNYVYADEWILNGYTRYGAWYGQPYGNWDAMFASFVLHYAGVDDLGRAEDPNEWAKKIAQELPRRYQTAGGYQPGLGDLVFFDRDLDGEIDGVGILAAVSEDTWRVMEGNTEDAVTLVNYAPGDHRIAAYGLISAPENFETEHTVTYVANNGTEETAPQQVSGEAVASWNGFSAPDGMTLSGWNTAPDGSGIDYEDGEKLALTEDVTLYAQWAETNANSNTPPASPVSSTGSIELKKQIEWIGTNADDYSYRLHLTLDGSTLSAGSVTTVTPTTKRRIGILLDVTETMTARGESWDGSGNKFDVVWSILREKDGLLDTILDGNTEVFVIKVGSASTGSDRMGIINSGTILSQFTFSGSGNSLHQSHPISYVTGLNAAEKYLGDNLDSLVFIVGNETTHYESYKGGVYDKTQSGLGAAESNYKDYEKFMANHPQLSMYMLGVASQKGFLEHHSDCGEYTAEKWGAYSKAQHGSGGYFKASNKTELKNQLTQIAQQIVVPADKVSGITVTDPLSGNVTLASDPRLSAVLTTLNSDGSAKETKTVTDVKLENGVLTCNYPDEIQGPFKLEITFDIQTADGVYQPKDGYTETGAADTDWAGNTTSSGQPGFFSNGDATADYTLNGTASTGLLFPKPVVQAPQKATVELTKVWENAAEADMKPVTVELHRGSAEGELVGTVVLNAENRWTASCDVKILAAEGTSNQIYVVEQALEGFTPSYSAADVSVVANNTHPITVTNTKQGQKATLTVTKHWQDVSSTQDAVIHVCVNNGTEYKDIEGSPFRFSSGTDGSQQLTVKWTEAVPPVLYIYEECSDDFYPLIGGEGTATTITIADQTYSAMELIPQADGSHAVTITNMPVVPMPETGGPGTQWYVFSGLALILSAALLMQIRKNKAERRAT